MNRVNTSGEKRDILCEAAFWVLSIVDMDIDFYILGNEQ